MCVYVCVYISIYTYIYVYLHIYMCIYIYVYIHIYLYSFPPKNGEIALWLPTNMSIPYILVLAGNESTITEITE